MEFVRITYLLQAGLLEGNLIKTKYLTTIISQDTYHSVTVVEVPRKSVRFEKCGKDLNFVIS